MYIHICGYLYAYIYIHRLTIYTYIVYAYMYIYTRISLFLLYLFSYFHLFSCYGRLPAVIQHSSVWRPQCGEESPRRLSLKASVVRVLMPWSGQSIASSNELTLNSSFCWEYTQTGLNSGFGARIICAVQIILRVPL